MSQQTYPWPCVFCGTVHRFTAEDVGTKVLCECANLLVVPDLNTLRGAVPEEEVSPDFAFAEATRLGQLPFESRCAVCRVTASEVVTLVVEGRGSRVGTAAESWGALAARLMRVGFFYNVAAEALGEEEVGPRTYTLPVRACGGCRPKLSEARAAATAILKTSLYARLLADSQRVRLLTADGTPVVYPTTPPYATTRRARRVAIGWVLGIACAPLANFALLVTVLSIIAGKKVPEWPMGMIFVGILVLSIVIGALIGHFFGRWHLRRWPETDNPS